MSTLQHQPGAAPHAAPGSWAKRREPVGPRVAGIVLVAAGALLLREAIVAANEYGLTIGGPRLAPIVVAAGWTVLALTYLATRRARSPSGERAADTGGEGAADSAGEVAAESPTGTAWLTPALMVAALVAYVLVLETIGFVLATAAFFLGAARILGSTRLIRDILVGVPLALVAYLAFTRILEIRLPEGVLGL